MGSLVRRGALAGVVIAVAAAAPVQAARPNPFYGIYTENSHHAAGEVPALVGAQAATGAGLIREPLDWNTVETSPGTYDWSRFDAVAGAAAKNGVAVLAMVWNPPSFRQVRPDGATKAGMYPPSPAAMAGFLRRAVQRYGPHGTYWCKANGRCRKDTRPIRAWQVWNEPDLAAFWPQGPSASGYAALLRRAANTVHRADKGAEVVLGGLTVKGATRGGYLDQLYATGVMKVVDTLAAHPYGRSVGAMLDRVAEMRKVANAHGDRRRPIRVTEYGWATGGKASLDQVVDEPCQAALLHQATRALAARRTSWVIKGIVAFNWDDRPPTRSIWPFFTGLVRADGSPKPALSAFTDAVARTPLPEDRRIATVCGPTHQALDTDPGGPTTYDPYYGYE